MSNPIVIDISHHQPDPIDWQAVKAGGTIGVIHKATEGSTYVDEDLYHRARAAMDAGLCWSTYHFLRPGSMQTQMSHYLSTVDPKPGERMCLDHEDAGVSLADLKEAVAILLDDPRGLQVTIYSGHVIKDQLGSTRDEFLAANTSLWIAQYTSASSPSWPTATWPAWSLWQHTDKGSCNGIDGNVDANRWNGDPANIAAWFGPAGEQPAPSPEPEPEYPIVTLDVALPANVALHVTVNGGETHTWVPKENANAG